MNHLEKILILGILLITIASCTQKEKADRINYFTPGTEWKDTNGTHINAHGGGILFREGVYYWFGEHKIEGEKGNRAQVGVHCYSSEDLYNWKDEGIALGVMPEGSGSDIEKGSIIERPKVIYNEKTKKYVMWFHLELKNRKYSSALSGVATSDKVMGPYTYLKSVRPNAGHWPLNYPDSFKIKPVNVDGAVFTGGSISSPTHELNLVKRDLDRGQMARDMTLFKDDDGKAYHIYSSEENSTLHIALLDEDYTSHTGQYVRIFADRFMEAPAMFKKDGKYYLIMSGCTGWAPNAARSAVADSIFGEWKELGNPCLGEGAETTFESQSTFVVRVVGTDKYIYMGDRWCPENPIGGTYVWLPINFTDNGFAIEWKDRWSLDDNNKNVIFNSSVE